MAAWLAFLKSRLLLPEPPQDDEGPSGEEMAAALSHRLQLLAAMQRAGAALMERPLLGRDVFPRGAPEGIPRIDRPVYRAEPLRASERLWRQPSPAPRRGPDRRAARAALAGRGVAASRHGLVGHVPEWRELAAFLPDELPRRHLPPFGAWPRPSRRCSNWRAPDASNCARTVRSVRSICAAAPAAPPGFARCPG